MAERLSLIWAYVLSAATAVVNVYRTEPVVFTQVVGLVVTVAAYFHLSLTAEQVVGFVLALETLVALVQRQSASPSVRLKTAKARAVDVRYHQRRKARQVLTDRSGG